MHWNTGVWTCLLVLGLPARAASLDNLEIGGPWGTPNATGGTATWWNPAGLATVEGTRFQLEAAPTLGGMSFERDDPNGGPNEYTLSGLVPFAGVATDLGLGLPVGLGASLSVPYIRGGSAVDQTGSGRYHLRDGHVQALVGQVGLAGRIRDRVSLGVTVGMLQSSWVARVDNELMVELNDLMDDEFEDLTEQLGGIPYRDTCEDDAEDCFALEDPDYAATLDFENLGDTVLSWSVGGQVDILPELRAALTYIHGAAVDNQGDVTLAFSCPPEADTLGRLGSELFGLCDQTLQAHASLAYTLPSRLHGGLQFDATPTLQLELMGGWVNWSVFDAYEITIYDTESLNELANPDTAELVNQERKWARDNQDSAWGGLDAKWRLHEQWLLGGRALFDRSAVPSWALSPNNYDADTLMLSALAAVSPLPQLQVGLSFTHHVVATRVVDDSQFAMTLAQADRRADAWNYPHSNGTYDGFTERVGIQVRGNFGGGDR